MKNTKLVDQHRSIGKKFKIISLKEIKRIYKKYAQEIKQDMDRGKLIIPFQFQLK